MKTDILGLGCVTVDEILHVEAFPGPDEKTLVLSRERQCGGLTGTALVAAARFGASCAYGGVLGFDDLSKFVIERLNEEGIDLSTAPRLPDARPIHATIVVDTTHHTRNIFVMRGEHVGCHLERTRECGILAAKSIFVDHYGGEATVRACRIAKANGIPIIADLERSHMLHYDEILGLVDHLVLSQAFARKVSRADSPQQAAERLFTSGRQVVIITCGAEGCWVVSADNNVPRHFPAFPVSVLDTTGCGDVFHGVYAAALTANVPLEQRIRYAAAAAAMKAMHAGAQRGIPRRAELMEFLSSRTPAKEE